MSYYKPFVHIFAVFLLFSLLLGCSSEESTQSGETAMRESSVSMVQPGQAPFPVKEAKSTAEDAKTTSTPSKRLDLPVAQSQQKIIYTASIRLSVDDYKEIHSQIEQKARQYQGYLVNSNESKTSQRHYGELTFRIPQAQFDPFIKEIQKLDVSTPEISISGNDVTDEMVDLESRLKAKEAMEQRLLDLMKRATKTEDLLDISRQLDQTQVEIEQIKGRLQYLNNKVDFSTVNITIIQRLVGPTSSGDQSLGEQMADSFRTSLSGLGVAGEKFLIFLSGAFPVLLMLMMVGIPVYLIVRKYYQKKVE